MAEAQNNISLSVDSIYTDLMERFKSHPRITDEFEDIEVIGSGGCGVVLKVKKKTDSKVYALKLIPLSSCTSEEKCLREVDVLANLEHDNVVRYYYSWFMKDMYDHSLFDDDENEMNDDSSLESRTWKSEVCDSDYFHSSIINDHLKDDKYALADVTPVLKRPLESDVSDSVQFHSHPLGQSTETHYSDKHETRVLCILMEYCEQTVKEFIRQQLTDREEKLRIINEIVNGLTYIHSKGVIHRDLKPANIFLDRFGGIKIGDFGLAMKTESFISEANFGESSITSSTKNIGTFYYRSPEIINGKYDCRVDLYSLGIIIFELSYRCVQGMERKDILENLRIDAVLFPNDFNKKADTVSNIHDVITGLLQHNPNERMTLSTVKEKIDNKSNEELGCDGIKKIESFNEKCPVLLSIGQFRFSNTSHGLGFRVGSNYILATNHVAEKMNPRISSHIEFYDFNSESTQNTFNCKLHWRSITDDVSIIELCPAAKSKRKPPSLSASSLMESTNDLAFIRVLSQSPFQCDVTKLKREELKETGNGQLYIETILPPHNHGSPIFQMSENGSYVVCGMLLANYYADGQKKGTCVIDTQEICACFSPPIPRYLRKNIFGDSKIYRCYETLIKKIELRQTEAERLKRCEEQLRRTESKRLLEEKAKTSHLTTKMELLQIEIDRLKQSEEQLRRKESKRLQEEKTKTSLKAHRPSSANPNMIIMKMFKDLRSKDMCLIQ